LLEGFQQPIDIPHNLWSATQLQSILSQPLDAPTLALVQQKQGAGTWLGSYLEREPGGLNGAVPLGG
jgi:hypothetical protein